MQDDAGVAPEDQPSNIIAFPAAGRNEGLADSALMIRFVREGDDAAFDALLERHYPSALAVARSRLGDGSLAQDVVQEAFLRVFRERRRYDPERSFAAWFYTILRNLVTDAARGRLRHREKMEALANEGRGAPRASADASDCDNLLSMLSAPEREILIYHYIHGMSLREISGLLLIGPEAAKKRLQRALKRLKEIVSRDGGLGRAACEQ
jgi:RNA polymerase sigma factor (sigma-70 family)